jgi:hypothetical protein
VLSAFAPNDKTDTIRGVVIALGAVSLPFLVMGLVMPAWVRRAIQKRDITAELPERFLRLCRWFVIGGGAVLGLALVLTIWHALS